MITLYFNSNYFPLSDFLLIILHLAVETVMWTRREKGGKHLQIGSGALIRLTVKIMARKDGGIISASLSNVCFPFK